MLGLRWLYTLQGAKAKQMEFLPRITDYQSQKEPGRSLSSTFLCKLLQKQRPKRDSDLLRVTAEPE